MFTLAVVLNNSWMYISRTLTDRLKSDYSNLEPTFYACRHGATQVRRYLRITLRNKILKKGPLCQAISLSASSKACMEMITGWQKGTLFSIQPFSV